MGTLLPNRVPAVPHARLAKIVVRAVRGARGADIAASRTGRLRLARFGIVEIEAPEIGPQRDEVDHGEEKPETVPDDASVDETEQIAQQPLRQSGPIWLDHLAALLPSKRNATVPRSSFDRQGRERRPGELGRKTELAVVSKKVVLVGPGNGGLAGECGVRPMDVVGVRPPRQRVCSFR